MHCEKQFLLTISRKSTPIPPWLYICYAIYDRLYAKWLALNEIVFFDNSLKSFNEIFDKVPAWARLVRFHGFIRAFFIKRQSCHHTETTQLNGFYMITTLVFNEWNYTARRLLNTCCKVVLHLQTGCLSQHMGEWKKLKWHEMKTSIYLIHKTTP